MLKKISIILLIIILSFLGYVYLSGINLLEIGGNSQINYYPYIRFSLALIIGLLLVLIFKKNKNFYYFLHLIWIVSILYFLLYQFFGFYNTQKLDYLLGKTINNYKIKQYIEHENIVNEITIKNPNKTDTLYVSESPIWKNKSYQLKSKAESKIVKSWMTGYYYVSVKE